MEYNDIYDKHRNLTGRVHCRGTRWRSGEYGLVVCVWVYDGKGKLLLTKRAPEKSFPGTWENSGGAVRAGETSLQAIVRELREETGIIAQPEEFELIDSGMDGNTHFDYYCLKRQCPIEDVILLPGETVDATASEADATESGEDVATDTTDNADSDSMVWIPTHGGEKYHTSAECSDMIEPERVSLAFATECGFTPCSFCYG